MADTAPVHDWATDYDINDPGYIEDPVPVWRELRGTCPIAHTDRHGGSWLPTRFDDVREMAKMVPELSSRQPLVMPTPEALVDMTNYEQQIAAPPITADPPIATWTRRMILPAFAPRAVERYRDFTEELCHRLIDGFIESGRCDGAVDYSQQIPPRVIAHMLGVNPDMADDFTEWVRGVLELGLSQPELRMKYRDIIREFLEAEVNDRVDNPRDDLLSELLAVEVDPDLGENTPEVVVGIANLLLVAGIDTTWSSIGSALYHLGTTPSDREWLVREPELLPTAVEELLRAYSPVTMARVAETDVQIGDVTIRKGDKVLMNFPGVNHDPEHFDNPDAVILDRARNRHIAFGSGIHRCAGSNLARLEMNVALRVWLERIPEFEVSDREPMQWAGGQVRGPRVMPISFPAGSRR